jgi:SH3 domain-containing protein
MKRGIGLAVALFCGLHSSAGRAAEPAASSPGASSSPPADDMEPEAFAKVVVDSAELRTGPGVSYRVIYDAHRGETFALDGRPGAGFWLRVLLPDGRIAYALGDEVQPFAVSPGEEGGPSRPGLFAPPPLEGARGGFAMLGGMLSIPVLGGGVQRFGYIEARPSLVLHKTVSLEAFIGDGLTTDGAQLLYGGGVAIYLAPSWPVCPFVGLSAGGLSVLPNPDSFVLKREDMYIARAGGGILFALRNRILVRLEATNLSVFSAESYKNAQTYAGGLGVYF